MSVPLILLHEEALRITHPVFTVAPNDTKAVYIWDDDYFRRANYSLKRLVFIYETLCELPIEIFQGNTLMIIQGLAPSTLYLPTTNNPLLISLIDTLKLIASVELVADEAFVQIKSTASFKRFSQYWNKIEHSAFKLNGDMNA
jgi:hypothetical protein